MPISVTNFRIASAERVSRRMGSSRVLVPPVRTAPSPPAAGSEKRGTMTAQETYQNVDAAGTIKRDGSMSIDALGDEGDSLRTMDAQGLIRVELVHEEQHRRPARFVRLR